MFYPKEFLKVMLNEDFTYLAIQSLKKVPS